MNKEAVDRLGFTDYDTADYLRDDDDARAYLLACMEESGNDAAFIAKALGTIARSRVAMADVAKKSGLSRESLYKALSGSRDPSFSTILKVASALGLRLTFEAATSQSSKPIERVASPVGNQFAADPIFSVQHELAHFVLLRASTVGDVANLVLVDQLKTATLVGDLATDLVAYYGPERTMGLSALHAVASYGASTADLLRLN